MSILVNKTNNKVILQKVMVAKSVWQRFKGLMGQPLLPEGTGLLLSPCNSVHCFFMKFPIDVAFLDKEGQVLRVIAAMKPWRVSPIVKHAAFVVECNANTLEGKLQVGDTVKLLKLY